MAEFKRCPICGASIKLENIERHAARAHPGQRVDYGVSEEEKEIIKAKTRPKRPMGRREKMLYPVLAVVIVIVVAVSAIFLIPPGGPGPDDGLDIGDPAPNFVLPRSDGGSFRLADYRGQVVLLDFMDVDCVFCQQETALVLAPLSMDDRYASVVAIVSVTVNPLTPFDDMNAFKVEHAASWPYVRDDGTVAPQYDVKNTPTLYILTRNHLVNQFFVGLTDIGVLRAALDAALGA